jgi:hypothetical protein
MWRAGGKKKYLEVPESRPERSFDVAPIRAHRNNAVMMQVMAL